MNLFIKHINNNPAILCDHKNLYVISDNVPESYIGTIKSAVDYWNNGIGKEILIYGGLVHINPGDIQNTNYVVIGVASYDDTMDIDALAVARVNYRDNCIRGARVSIQSIHFDGDMIYFENIVRHEVGHVLGLTHSPFKEDVTYFGIDRWPFLKDAHSSVMDVLKKYYTEKRSEQ